MHEIKVLLIDDEVEFVSTLAERLQIRGIGATAVTSGAAALRRIEFVPPQVVVVDLMMPGLSGLDVLQALKERHPEIPVILLTGRGSTKEGIDGMRLGAFDYMMKPLKVEELIEKIEEAVKLSSKT